MKPGGRIIRELEDMGLPYERVTETGIVAEIKGIKPGDGCPENRIWTRCRF